MSRSEVSGLDFCRHITNAINTLCYSTRQPREELCDITVLPTEEQSLINIPHARCDYHSPLLFCSDFLSLIITDHKTRNFPSKTNNVIKII